MWCETVTISKPDNRWWMESVQKKSLNRLAAVCLYTPEVPFRGVDSLVLTEESFLEVTLAVSSWLQTNGDSTVPKTCYARSFEDASPYYQMTILGMISTLL